MKFLRNYMNWLHCERLKSGRCRISCYGASRIWIFAFILLSSCGGVSEPTKAIESGYEKNILKANTSDNLTKADLAWHAQNTYGWDCAEVTVRHESSSEGYFFIECSSGKKLRVYPRTGKHPKITNEYGGYD